MEYTASWFLISLVIGGLLLVMALVAIVIAVAANIKRK